MRTQDLFKSISNRNLQRLGKHTRGNVNVDEYKQNRMTPLVFALNSFQYLFENRTFDDVILHLIDVGSDVNARHPLTGMTATMLAMKCSRKDEIIVKFINAGTDVNLRCKSDKSVLIHGLESRYGKMVISELLNKGADPDYPSEGYTPLYCAVSIRNDPDVIAMLLTSGANINSADVFGKPLLAYLCQDRCKLEGICRYKQVIDILIAKGAGLTDTFTYGNTLLHIATCNYVIYLALKDGVSIETKNDSDLTPLFYSLIYDEPQKASDLLLIGANPNCSDKDGCTPLHDIRVTRNEQFVTLLLFHGSELVAENSLGRTTFDEIFSDVIIYNEKKNESGIKTLMKHYMLYVDENGLNEIIMRISNSRQGYFLHFIDACKVELRIMRNIFLNEELSFYDFCRSRRFYRNEIIPIMINHHNVTCETISKNFPIFKDVIFMRLRDNVIKQLKRDLLKMWTNLSVKLRFENGTESDIFNNCWNVILKYLNFKQLYSLFAASFNG